MAEYLAQLSLFGDASLVVNEKLLVCESDLLRELSSSLITFRRFESFDSKSSSYQVIDGDRLELEAEFGENKEERIGHRILRSVAILLANLGNILQVGNEQALSDVVFAERLVEVDLGAEAYISGYERLQIGEHRFDLFDNRLERLLVVVVELSLVDVGHHSGRNGRRRFGSGHRAEKIISARVCQL